MSRLVSRRAALKAAFAAFAAAASVPLLQRNAAAGTAAPGRIYVPGYRSELARAGNRLLVDIPEISRVPAGYTENRTLLAMLDLADPEAAPKRAAYPVRGHGLALLPEKGVGVFGGMESDTAVGFDLETLDLRAFIRPQREGWRFGGHPARMPDGVHVALAERHPADPKSGDREADIARLAGKIVIRDAVTLAPVHEFSSYGIRPHEIQITADGRHMVVANYGSTNAVGSSDEAPAVPVTIAPGISIIEIASGRLMAWIDGADPLAELRHLSATRLDRIFAVTTRMAFTNSPEAAGLQSDPNAETDFTYLASQPQRVADGSAVRLLADEIPLTRHGLSIAYDPGADEILITFPATHTIALFDGATGTAKKLIRTDKLGLQWPCGVALSPDRTRWLVSGYWNGILSLGTGSHLIDTVSPLPKWWGHSHSVVA